ncbi:MAG: uroporphyrinogen-III C-methyltransferase [Dehalococcoidia bacterium]|nr:uroporphyrinogen-III C-methyltransferase [Dehalococcoidia bacterium]
MSATVGTVYLVGAGPGDPGLLTVKGLACLQKAQVVVYDRLVSPRVLAHAPQQAERIYAGKSAAGHEMEQEEINALLAAKAKEGKVVVRLKGGDPFVFGRGGEEAERLAGEGVPFEIVPGVSSAIAAAAYAGIPVTHRDASSSFAVITGREDPGKAWTRIHWDKLAGGVGTLVVLMGVETLPETVAKLREHGMASHTPAAVIGWGTWPKQRTAVGTLADIVAKTKDAGIGAPAVTVIGEVVRLREKLRWFDSKPLFGRRVLVTRARTQASALAERLEELGAEAVEAAAIEILGPRDYVTLDRAMRKLPETQWAVFTSVNAVQWMMDRMESQGRDARSLAGVKVCAIGPATAASLRSRGIRADYVPEQFTTEAIMQGLGGEGRLEGQRIVLYQADIAPQDIVQALEGRGAQVQRVAAYQTVTPAGAAERAKQALAEGVDVITFTSSSTVEHLCALLGEGAAAAINRAKIASIGPITTRTAERLGVRVDATAEEHTIPGLVQAVLGLAKQG